MSSRLKSEGLGGSASSRIHSKLGKLPLEEVACYLCGSSKARLLLDDPPFKVLRCRDCGLGYVSPRVRGDRIHELYGDQYWNSDSASDFGYTSYKEDRAGYLKSFARKARILEAYQPRGRVLEVGSAAGFFLAVMQEQGYEVHGLEISATMAQASRQDFDLPDVRSCLLAEAGFEPQSFDLVVLWDVVEHIADPIAELKRCRQLLKPEGSLVLQTQDISSLAARLLGRRWHHFKQLEHIYHFDRHTIAALLARSGFEIAHNSRRGAGKYISFLFLAERLRRFGPLAGLLGRCLGCLGKRFIYINPLDEMLIIARPLRPAAAAGDN